MKATFGVTPFVTLRVSGVLSTRRIVAGLVCLSCAQGVFASVIESQIWPANGHRYYMLNEATWSASEAEAVSLGGYLATVNSQAENDWLWSTFVPLIPPEVKGYGGLWVGYTDSEAFGASEGSWAWVSGESSAYTNWHAGEPNDDDIPQYDEDFAFIWIAESGRWIDADNAGSSGLRVYGVVEVVPLPPAVWLLGAGLLSYLGLGRRKAV